MEKKKRKLIKGNEAVGMAAVAAGCRYYFGYPITPQSEIPEYLARVFPKIGGVFLQAESEIASINMLLGAGSAGERVMTSSSGPGISLMQEGISYMAGSEVPGVIVNVQRSGPGLGGISPSQGDYFQASRGGGHGDYRTPVLAPDSVQEMWDLTILAFDLADRYRTPVVVLADAMLGQMKEPLTERVPEFPPLPAKDWITTGAQGREPRILKSLYLADGELEKHCWDLHKKYLKMKEREVRFEDYQTADAELIVVGFGSAARISKTAVDRARGEGKKVGLFRPITICPFPEDRIAGLADAGKSFLVVELNTGQMLDDVRMSAGRRAPIHFYGRPNGAGSLPTPDDILHEIMEAYPG
ncbi:MAG TPA: 3-methyl-2-oxobutanoate dehydrogenase subunit VorB [bacterium]|nr:3-methyl-2-oxobutanoate dehydrogenase subunit VorB [bacterium]